MKKLVFVFTAALALAAVTFTTATPARATEGTSETKATFAVQKVACSSCAGRIKDTVGKLDGVHNVAVNVEERRVVVAFDKSKISAETIRKNIEKLGFPAKSVDA